IIKNSNGSIVPGSSALIRTNTLDIEATGSIGASNARLAADLVQSVDPVSNTLRALALTAVASTGNLYLDLRARSRDGGAYPLVIHADALSAGGDINVLLESGVRDSSTPFTTSGSVKVNGTPYSNSYPSDTSTTNYVSDPGVFGTTT